MFVLHVDTDAREVTEEALDLGARDEVRMWRRLAGLVRVVQAAHLVVDTGGWQPDAEGLSARVAAQAEVAVAAADAVMLVVNATIGPTDEDEAVVKVLRRARKPVVLAANKVTAADTRNRSPVTAGGSALNAVAPRLIEN